MMMGLPAKPRRPFEKRIRSHPLELHQFKLSHSELKLFKEKLGYSVVKQKSLIEYASWNLINMALLDTSAPEKDLKRALSDLSQSASKIVNAICANNDRGSYGETIRHVLQQVCERSRTGLDLDSLTKLLLDIAWVAKGFGALDFGPLKEGRKLIVDSNLSAFLRELTQIAFRAGSDLKLPSNELASEIAGNDDLSRPFLLFVKTATDLAVIKYVGAVREAGWPKRKAAAGLEHLKRYTTVSPKTLIKALRRLRKEVRPR